MSSISVNLEKFSAFINVSLVVGMIFFALVGTFVHFLWHIVTVALLFANLLNFYYMFVQKDHAVLANFGMFGQMRYLIESVGPEFRQYLFLNDTEERPFNREERSEVYRKAKDIDSSSSFGSLKEFSDYEFKIRHSMYPVDKKDLQNYSLTFGEERGIKQQYTITKPFIISAMSYGALGERAVRALARGAKKAGIPMNTGEGGHPKYHLAEACELIFQIGTAKFGVRHHDGTLDEAKLKALAQKPQIKMVEIKLSQGAKPGKGGLLPKEKITPEIAKLRGVPMGKDVLSPPHHIECTDAKSTIAFIRRVQDITELPVGIKLCLGRVDEFEGLVDAMISQKIFPDYISVDGAEGGTGAAPKGFMDDVGIRLMDALPLVHDILLKKGVRDRMKLLAAGKLINPGKQFTALCLGADAVYTARGFMLALGCIQALQCNKNTCPVGITTHDKKLQRGLDIEAKAQRIANYAKNLDHDFYELLSSSGSHSVEDLSPKSLFVPKYNITQSTFAQGRRQKT